MTRRETSICNCSAPLSPTHTTVKIFLSELYSHLLRCGEKKMRWLQYFLNVKKGLNFCYILKAYDYNFTPLHTHTHKHTHTHTHTQCVCVPSLEDNTNVRNAKGASLVVQWLRIRLPMQGTWVRALVREDPTCRRATTPESHNYWARVPRAHALQQEKPPQWEARALQRRPNAAKNK